MDDEHESLKKINKSISVLISKMKKENSIENREKFKLLLLKRRRLVNNSFNRGIVATKIIFNNLSRKKIIFTESINQAIEIKDLCNDNGLEVLMYHSKMSRMDRIMSLKYFIENDYNTLIGCKALDEGFDVPDIDFAIIASQTTTKRQRIQRLGRTIRVSKDKKYSPTIYTLFSTQSEYNDLKQEEVLNSNINVTWSKL